jgi:Mrp family chromosome partitioning ATPase
LTEKGRLEQLSQDITASLEAALKPPQPIPGFAPRRVERVEVAAPPGWFIDRCRRIYMSIPGGGDRSRTIGITSTLPGEGKTSVALGIATALASDTREPTLLLECDLERSSLARICGCAPSPGLREWVENLSPLRIVRSSVDNLFIIPAGTPPSDPTRLIWELAESKLVASLSAEFRNTVIDLPALVGSSSGSLAARLADQLVLVVRSATTPMDEVERAVELIGRERFAGAVLNAHSPRRLPWGRSRQLP